jgi:hypothetical protein
MPDLLGPQLTPLEADFLLGLWIIGLVVFVVVVLRGMRKIN